MASTSRHDSWCDCYKRQIVGPYPNVYQDGGETHDRGPDLLIHVCKTCRHYGTFKLPTIVPAGPGSSYIEIGEMLDGFRLCDCPKSVMKRTNLEAMR
jgi:hypothetical protein